MDDRRFDSLTRALAQGTSRRSLLEGILGLGGLATGGAVVRDDGPAEAHSLPGH